MRRSERTDTQCDPSPALGRVRTSPGTRTHARHTGVSRRKTRPPDESLSPLSVQSRTSTSPGGRPPCKARRSPYRPRSPTSGSSSRTQRSGRRIAGGSGRATKSSLRRTRFARECALRWASVRECPPFSRQSRLPPTWPDVCYGHLIRPTQVVAVSSALWDSRQCRGGGKVKVWRS